MRWETAFATPVALPVNILVLAPGQYRFGDFVRVGVPLQLIALAGTVILVPRPFPPASSRGVDPARLFLSLSMLFGQATGS